MRIILKLSILLNLLLAGGLLFVFVDRRREETHPLPASPDIKLPVSAVTGSVPPVASETAATPFRWQQLDSGDDYRLFVANLRAIGCPENTIDDVVRGNVNRAFAWERARLKIDDSGNGPWSGASEARLINSLLGKSSLTEVAISSQGINGPVGQRGAAQTAPTRQNTENATQQNGDGEITETSSQPQGGQAGGSPLSYQNANWNADAAQRAAWSQAQQPLNGNNSGNLNPNTPAYQNDGPGNPNPNNTPVPDPSQTAPSVPSGPPNPLGPDDPFALGGEDKMIADMGQYYDWFQPQATANASGESLNINPGAFTSQ
jgi:hypothetical protein